MESYAIKFCAWKAEQAEAGRSRQRQAEAGRGRQLSMSLRLVWLTVISGQPELHSESLSQK